VTLTAKEQLLEILATPLPSKTVQRRLSYVPTKEFTSHVFDLLNECVFGGHLTRPCINFRSLLPKHWGLCIGFDEDNLYCKLRLNRGFYCVQWFVIVLAHEMAHQHQWVVQGPHRRTHKKEPLLSHGKTFYLYKNKLAEIGIPLKVYYDDVKWFKYQQMLKI